MNSQKVIFIFFYFNSGILKKYFNYIIIEEFPFRAIFSNNKKLIITASNKGSLKVFKFD